MNKLTPPHRQETPPPDPSYRLESAGRHLPTREDVKKQTAHSVIKNWLVKETKKRRNTKHGGKKTKQKSRKSRKSK